jgi:integrase
MNYRFFLDYEKSDGTKRISIKIIGEKTFWLKTNRYTYPRDWRQSAQTSKDPTTKEYLGLLRTILSDIEKQAYVDNKLLTPEYVRKQFAIKTGREKKKSRLTFIDWFDHFREVNKKKMSPDHLRKFIQVKSHLEEFNPSLDFEGLNNSFYDQYLDYLVEKGLSNNTISKHIKCIVAVCKAASKTQQVPNHYLGFKTMDVSYHPVYLTKEETHDLLSLKGLKDSEQKILDDFAFRYYTSIRNSDMDQLGKEHFQNIKGQWYINFNVMKTRRGQMIPLHDKALEIAKRYDFQFPKMSLQNKNRVIKDLAKKAEINTPVEVVSFSLAKRSVQLVPKWKKISSHTARRSFGRRFMESTGDINKLREIYGQKDVRTTLIYIGWEPEEIAESVRGVEF